LVAASVHAAQPERAVPAAAATSSPAGQGSANAAVAEMRLSKLVGTNVQGRGGSDLGEIKDLVFDANSGEVRYAIVAAGGALGVGEKRFAIPLAHARLDDKGKLNVDVDKAQLEAAPAIDPKRMDKPGVQATARDTAGSEARNARFRRASDVMKTKVRDAQGGTIGDVHDMIVDVGAGRVQQVVVRFDRAWNPSDKLIALPMSAFSDGATASERSALGAAAAPPHNTSSPLALLNPSGEPSKGTASAVSTPGSVETRPPAIEPARGADSLQLERAPLPTTTSYADDENLVYKGTREQLVNAPAFDAKRY
jgi:sporulation protein YlmC with PRC-barrel domain